jgi:hypothetical protein
MNALLQFMVIALSLMIIFVSFSPLCRMPGGFTLFCHKMKYLMAMVSGRIFIYCAARDIALPIMLVLSFGLFMFIWPRVAWWIKNVLAAKISYWYEYTLKPSINMMIVPISWLLYACAVVILLFGLVFLNEARAATPCDEWANFTKIITYKFRDSEVPKQAVIDELARVMPDNPELLTANKWIELSYNHKELSPKGVWLRVYDECRAKGTM